MQPTLSSEGLLAFPVSLRCGRVDSVGGSMGEEARGMVRAGVQGSFPALTKFLLVYVRLGT